MNGVWDRPRARKLFKGRQGGSERSASHKAAFSCRKKNNKKRKGFTEKGKKMRGTSGDLLEQHSAACGGMKGGHIASPWRIGDPPYPSFCS